MHWRVAVSVIAISLFATLPASARNIRFTAAKTKATGIDHTRRVAVGDFNHDGNPDLAISSTYNQVAIFLGKGNGT